MYKMPQITLVAHNLRSTHNVGSLLRTADGLGVSEVYLTGYTPYPAHKEDKRLPHLANKIDAQIAKTALGAQKSVSWYQNDDIGQVITNLKSKGYVVAALEQTAKSVALGTYHSPKKLALVVGREVEGLEPEVLDDADVVLEIPMLGAKESLNVAIAAAIALYSLKNQA